MTNDDLPRAVLAAVRTRKRWSTDGNPKSLASSTRSKARSTNGKDDETHCPRCILLSLPARVHARIRRRCRVERSQERHIEKATQESKYPLPRRRSLHSGSASAF